MSLLYTPSAGDILICNFPEDFKPPEMVKDRSVIVLSPQSMNRHGLVTIVPISLTAPDPVMPWHCEISEACMPIPLRDIQGTHWAKCDMVYTFSTTRLEMVKGKRDRQT